MSAVYYRFMRSRREQPFFEPPERGLPPMSSFKVLGAGPSGLTAALTLARAGHEVDVYERRHECGARFGGDLQALENWAGDADVPEWLDGLGLEINFDCTPFRSIVETNGRTSACLEFDRPMFYIVRRGPEPGSLDQGLKAQALAEGVRVHFGETRPPGEVDIVATGPVVNELFAVAKGIVFDTDHENLAAGFLNDRGAIKGYSYLVVVNHYACISSVLFDHFERAQRCFEEARDVLMGEHPMPMENVRSVGGVAHFSGANRFMQLGVPHAGEAAGLQELLWGFGMQTAIESGALASRSLIDGLDYQAEARARFGRRMSASIVNRALWELLAPSDYVGVIHGLKLNARATLRSLYRLNPLQRLLHAPARAYVRRRYPDLEL